MTAAAIRVRSVLAVGRYFSERNDAATILVRSALAVSGCCRAGIGDRRQLYAVRAAPLNTVCATLRGQNPPEELL